MDDCDCATGSVLHRADDGCHRRDSTMLTRGVGLTSATLLLLALYFAVTSQSVAEMAPVEDVD
jgi:hypothetical protein